MPAARMLASVSLDTDNLWSYLKTHGDPGWEARPSYLDTLIPMALDALDRLGLQITFFLVGVDADRPEHHPVLRSLTAAGHEVGNHSYEHEPWLHRYSRAELEREIERAETAIAHATGQRPIGFRGPGYSWSPDLLEILADREYLFDASTLPTYLGPLARAYYFWTAKLSPEERTTRAALFGTVRDGLRPVAPYQWALTGGRTLLEIPVTTIPVVKAPFHLSYLLYLARFSEHAMLAYLRSALAACRLAGVGPSFLLHPLDLLSGDDAPALRFFPGMDLPGARKRALFARVLGEIARQFNVVPMSAHARAILSHRPLRQLQPVPAA